MDQKLVNRNAVKRSAIEDINERATKKPIANNRIYKFKILLPNGTSVVTAFHDPVLEMPLQDFVNAVKLDYKKISRASELQRRGIMWNDENMYLEDAFGYRMREKICFVKFESHKHHILMLHDGSRKVADTFENMWDLTPDTDLLRELPEEYTYETALADLIDNSLQAVWSNGVHQRRLISLDIDENKITIFDSGPGMDGGDVNSIVKWGKMGASVHRASRRQAIGGKPPYLKPFFGMFGYGGSIASMHLGRRASVSSKTERSRKVYVLYLEREALLNRTGSERTWKTDGGIRDPLEDEIQNAPNGSFTKVEIFEPMKSLDIHQLQCRLKDIYFPYIQCDEISEMLKTKTPIEFQVNGVNLAEIEGGEIATTNLHSSNGPEFVFQLRFYRNEASKTPKSSAILSCREANARLKCVYFPIIEGKETIDRILEKLEADGFGVLEKYETFSRVSIRRLGRLLPDARWQRLPFMELRQRKGDRGQVLKRCSLRVKCFVETDAGFNPTPSKTDLAHHHPFTILLKNFGSKSIVEKEGMNITICKDGKNLSFSQLEREYQDWIIQMHELYDEEMDSGEDEATLVLHPDKKQLGISSDVVRLHQAIKRKGISWKSGQKIKILKGACAGCHKSNIYATLEYIMLEGFQGDAGGETRMICRPLGCPNDNGCILALNNGNPRLDIRSSLLFPVSVIDSGKCIAMDADEWEYQLDKQRQKTPSTIEILSESDCLELGIGGALPAEDTVYAGHAPANEIAVVVRPANFNCSIISKSLDQKYIMKDDLGMVMEIKYYSDAKHLKDGDHVYGGSAASSSHKGLVGLYIFPLGSKFPDIFRKAGVYLFTFSTRAPTPIKCDKRVHVVPSVVTRRWELLREKSGQNIISVGSRIPPFSIVCHDEYENNIPFKRVPKVKAKLSSKLGVLAQINLTKVDLVSDNSILKLQDMLIKSGDLDKIRPSYDATLEIYSEDESFSVSFACQVTPGSLHHVSVHSTFLENQLCPGFMIEKLVLEMFDIYGNHVIKGMEILLNVNGFLFPDGLNSKLKVDDHGCVDLSGLLEVSAAYGETASISVVHGNKIVFKREFHIEKRELRAETEIPRFCVAGSQLQNITFVVVNINGEVDESIHDEGKYGKSNTLVIKNEVLDCDDFVRYAFQHGRCVVPSISLPHYEGLFRFIASHSCHPEIQLCFEVEILQAAREEPDYTGSQCSNDKIFPIADSPFSWQPDNSVKHTIMELEDDILDIGSRIGCYENALGIVSQEKADIEQELSELQATLEPKSTPLEDNSYEDALIEWIRSKDHPAAAFFCRQFGELDFKDSKTRYVEDIVGVVAIMGTVGSFNLSKILAEYLGEEQMLAVVCRSYATAREFEEYEKNYTSIGDASPIGTPTQRRFLVVCLEDIRPFGGNIIDGYSRTKLVLPKPSLPSGEILSGFVGFAVNMVDLHNLYRHTRTTAGYGLRETLLYRLFGKLQVYETREHLKRASAFIEDAAVSLDGGMIRGNGIISFGNSEPATCFPVIPSEAGENFFSENLEIVTQIEEKELALMENFAQSCRLKESVKKAKRKFEKRKKRYTKLLETGCLLEYNTPDSTGKSKSPVSRVLASA